MGEYDRIWHMGAENGGFNPEIVIKQETVSKLRKEIKDSAILDRQKQQKKEDIDAGVKRVIEAMGVKKNDIVVDSLDGLDQMLKDPSLGDKSKENIRFKMDCLGEAMYKEMSESNDEQMKISVVAGSYSIEKNLPEGMFGFGDYIANQFTDNPEIRLVLETVDLFKNDEEFNSGDYLLDQIEAQKVILNNVKVDFTNKADMKAKAMAIKYLSDLDASASRPEPVQQNSTDRIADRMNEVVDKMGEIGEKIATSNENSNNNRENKNQRPEEEMLERICSNPETARIYSNKLLDVLENSVYKSSDLTITRTVTEKLHEMIYILDNKDNIVVDSDEILNFSDVSKEINARLALHDVAYYMEDSGYRVDNKGGGLAEAVSKASGDRRMLSKEVMTYLLKDSSLKKFNIPVAKAWNIMQDINFDTDKYKDLLVKVANDMKSKGLTPIDTFYAVTTNARLIKVSGVEQYSGGFFLDTDETRKAIVGDYIARELIGDSNGDAKKAWQLVNKLVSATGERSVFNFSIVGGDNLSEDIHFGYFRKDDKSKGKSVGPKMTRDIESLTPGWLRRVSGINKIQPIYAEDIKLSTMVGKENHFTYFKTWLPSKIHATRELLMNETPLPKDILSVSYFESIVDNFNKVDPQPNLIKLPDGNFAPVMIEQTDQREIEGPKKGERIELEYIVYNGQKIYKKDSVGNLRYKRYDTSIKDMWVGYFDVNGTKIRYDSIDSVNNLKSRQGLKCLQTNYLLGLFEMAATRPELGWTVDNILDLGKIVSESVILDEDNGWKKAFITQEQWNWLMVQYVASDENKDYTIFDALKRTEKYTKRRESYNAFFENFGGVMKKKGGKR